jgi:hypothetical protein
MDASSAGAEASAGLCLRVGPDEVLGGIDGPMRVSRRRRVCVTFRERFGGSKKLISKAGLLNDGDAEGELLKASRKQDARS